MPKGYRRKTHEPGQVIVKAKAPPRPPGRPKGSRNRATLMKEEHLSKILKAAGGYLIHEVEAVLKIVVRKAKDGDMQAAKMILDRAIPVRKAEQHLPKGPASITINIQSGEVSSNGEDQKNGTTVDGWADAADGEVWDAAQGGEGHPEHAGEGR